MSVSRGSVYVSRDALIRQMCQEGKSLSEMCRVLGGHKEDLKYYLESNNIPHKTFSKVNHGAANGRWMGGRIIDDDGYVLVKDRNHPNCDRHGYVREHRLVIEHKIGRYLSPSEVVHHIDGNKQNNSLDNLEIFGRNGEHLAKTLKGKKPKWTPDGVQRILAGVQKAVRNRQKTSRD